MQDLRRGVVHLLPAVEAATLAQGAHGVGEGVMDIMEQHPEMVAIGKKSGRKKQTPFLKKGQKQTKQLHEKSILCI